MSKKKRKSTTTSKKKPFYKRLWFWVFVIALLGSMGGDPAQTEGSTESTELALSTELATSAGTAVGTEGHVIETAGQGEKAETQAIETAFPTFPTTKPTEETTQPTQAPVFQHTYVLNTKSRKFHYSSCSSADDIKTFNKSTFTGTRDEIISRGYEPCGRCHP